ncbi:uncharacterized protein SCHCODRAFT_02520839 [Schizophyllum commune H4-8]|uniref:uncharacterized protein n=1 Tax=Schizophyllum commune (strain H4-8 / FGSC 9210) TaxID=578458 RepID=UPI00215EC4A8|nr:uncharacterized protein SCHCODRAFT_02520839 [Schizophyllum commune H4-8]KAI5885449.1 hypothetical protein SCHCODRAFT_02520839 [Schizophyllum commune H4-8]
MSDLPLAFECVECALTYSSREQLFSHNVLYKHYLCGMCLSAQVSELSLKYHKASRVHEARKWKCPLCTKRKFKTPSALAQHLESGFHPGVTRFHLVAAAQALPTAAQVAIRPMPGIYAAPSPMKLVEASAKPSSWTGSAYQCEKCPKAFHTLLALDHHLASAAHDEAELRCPACAAEFALTSALVHHLESGSCGLASYERIQTEASAIIGAVTRLLQDGEVPEGVVGKLLEA